MEVYESLASQQPGIALPVLVHGQSLALLAGHAAAVDVVVDDVGEELQLCGQHVGGEVPSQVDLPTVFGVEATVAYHILLCSLMHAIARQFAQVGRAKSAG